MLVCKGQWIPRGRTAIVCLAFLEVLMSQPKAGAESQQKLPAFKSSAPCRCICCSTCKQSSAPPAAPAPEQKITEADHFKEWLHAMLETILYKTSDRCAQRARQKSTEFTKEKRERKAPQPKARTELEEEAGRERCQGTWSSRDYS